MDGSGRQAVRGAQLGEGERTQPIGMMRRIRRMLGKPVTEREGRARDIRPTPSPTTMGLAADAILRFKRDLFEYGRQEALNAGDVRVDEVRLAALKADARAMAEEQSAVLFSPENSAHDRLLEARYEHALEQIPSADEGVRQSEDERRKRRDALADAGDASAAPNTPWILILFGTVFIGLTVAATLHDTLLYGLEETRQAWKWSLIGGLFAGAVIVWCELGTFRTAAAAKAWQFMGLIGGAGFGAGMLALRLVDAESSGSRLLGIGVAVLEMAIVVYVHWIGRGLRRQQEAHDREQAEYLRKLRVFQAAEQEVSSKKATRAEFEKTVEEHRRHLFDRESRHRQVEHLANGAVATVTDGYLSGKSENEGRLRGLRPRRN